VALEDDVAAATADLKAAIKEFNAAYGIPGTIVHLGPATEPELAQLERQIGRPLPDDFRVSLALQNGFPEADGETHILPAAAIAELYAGASELRVSMAGKIRVDDPDRIVVFGRPDEGESAFFFVIPEMEGAHAWPVFEFDEDEELEDSYADFLTFLKADAEGMREAIEEGSEVLSLDDLGI
jgi:cell wall assembly regulator SMI1